MKKPFKKVRILFTIPNFTTAGSGREMANIIYRLDKELFDVAIAVNTPGGHLFDELKNKGYKILVSAFTVPLATATYAIVGAARKQAVQYRKHHFDIWQSFNWSSDYSEALIAKFSGAKYVYVKKNMNWDRTAWKVKSFLSNRIIVRNSTLALTVFSPPYLRRKTHLIGGGVDIHKFKKEQWNEYRSKYNIPSDAYLLTCVAQLVRSKGQDTLIKALAELDDVYLVLAGAERDEAYGRELRELIDQHQLNNRVTLLGSIDDINALLNTSDAFVLPTSNWGGHEEGSPVALLEAMAAEIPVIASNVAGSRDLVVTNETGLLFQTGNIAELVACIKKYKNDNAFGAKMAANALAMVRNHHTLDIEATAFEKVYKKMMRIR